MVEEKKDERRSFLGPDETITYYIAPPNAEDIRGADWHYSKMYTRSLVEGITTSAEMMDILRQRGIIGPEFEQRATELQRELGEKLDALDKATDLEIKRGLSIEVYNAREELFQWNQRLSGPMNNTCEQISDDARLEYLTSCMIQTEDGKRVWSSYDDFLKEKNKNLAALAVRARLEVMLYLQGLDSDFLDKTPEAVAMREVEADIINRAEEALKAAEAIVQEEEEIVEAEAKVKAEVKPKAKPKTTRKRKTTTKVKKKTDG
jgi:hypothetical protein